MIGKLDTRELKWWEVTSWKIWNAQNKFYLEKNQAQPKKFLDGPVGFLEEYHKQLLIVFLHAYFFASSGLNYLFFLFVPPFTCFKVLVYSLV